ncbi:hypothetical protein K3495_g7165 [Podosphaera aphanis]|nr:hypothetical protein K3495_g7165 [Podosphaera aphanis]
MSTDNLLNSDAEVVEDILNHEDPEEQIDELFDPPIICVTTWASQVATIGMFQQVAAFFVTMDR